MDDTVTRRVTMTMPRRVSDILDRKAKRDSVPLSKAILAIIEDALDDDDPISEAEERRLVARAEKNEAESWRLYTHEEVFASLL